MTWVFQNSYTSLTRFDAPRNGNLLDALYEIANNIVVGDMREVDDL